MTTVARKTHNNDRFGIRPVRNEQDRQGALSRIDELMGARSLSDREADELEVLATLVEAYEREAFPLDDVTPEEILKSLVEDGGHSQIGIAAGTGIAASTISEILSGKRKINARHAVALGKFFGLRADLFLPRS